MRPLSFSIILLTILLCFSACGAEATPSTLPQQPDVFPAGQNEASEESEPDAESNQLPYDMQIASITPALQNRILEKKTQNRDSVGWLIVPDTTIDDVILLNPRVDNSYYLTHNFLRQPDRNGAYAMDYRFNLSGTATRDAFPRNTTLYAHNHDDNPDGILFSQLKKYKNPDFAKRHPYIFFSTTDIDMVWEVFAVYDATVDFPYIQPGVYWSSFGDILETIYDASIYDYGVTISESDKLLTLSTCTFSVAGHEAMPITAVNKYRFVIMARLVSPEEQIKHEAVFTVNDNPLPPDDMSMFSYLTRDLFMLNGLEYNNSWVFFDNNECVEPINFNKLVPIGEIKQSDMNDPLKDWEATQLPVGTVIYQDPDYPDVLVADAGWEKIPYIAQRQERELRSVRYIRRNRDGVITDKSLDAGQFDENEHMDMLSPFIDMIHFTPIPDDMDAIELHDSKDEIRIGTKNSLSTFYQSYFLGVPASVGKEVMIVRQQDGYYYGNAALYPRLAEILNSLFA